jgi:uncharacterized protein YwgA
MFISSGSKCILSQDELDSESQYLGSLIVRVSNFSMESLDKRKIFQKTVYLIQAFGIPLGYIFNWYLLGVYSPKLAEIGFYMKDKISEYGPAFFSNPDFEDKFNSFLSAIEPYKNNGRMLEVISSLHWFYVNNQGFDKEVYFDMVLTAKEYLNLEVEELQTGWEVLQHAGIV